MARAGRPRVRFVASTVKKGKQSDTATKTSSRSAVSDVAQESEQINAFEEIVEQPNIFAQINEHADAGSKSQSVRTSTQPPREVNLSPRNTVRAESITHHPSLHERIVTVLGGRRKSSSHGKGPSLSGNITLTKLSRPEAKSSMGASTVKNLETAVKKNPNETAAESSTRSKAPVPQLRHQVNRRRRKSQVSDRLRVTPEVPVDAGLRQSPSPAFTGDEENSEDSEEIFQFSETLEQRANQKSLLVIDALAEDEVVSKSKHARKVSLKKRKAQPAIKPTTNAQPEIPLDLHPGRPAYYEWLKKYGFLDENNRIRNPGPLPALPQYVDIKPAPAHELGGNAFVAKDVFAPGIIVRGFETPNSTPSAKKLNQKPKPTGTRFFVVPQEYACEHDAAVHNRAAHVPPPPRSTFVGLDGADDEEDEQHARPRANSHGALSALDGVGDQEAEETTPRASQVATGSPRASASTRRHRSVSFASSPRFFDGRGVADDEEANPRATRATRSVTASGATPPRRRRALTFLLGPRSSHGSLSAIGEDDQRKAFDQLSLGGTDFDSQRTGNQDQDVQPVILQHGHLVAEIPRTKTPELYQRAWGEFKDPFEKLRRDIEIEREQDELYEQEEVRRPRPLVLTDAEPPQGSPDVKRKPPSSPFKRRKNGTGSISSLSRVATYESMQADLQAIYLTPQEEIPNYPQAGSADYYEAFAKRPMFVFDSHGYLVRGNVTAKIIELFEGFHTAPTWASEIPDIKDHRAMKQESPKGIFGGKSKGNAKAPEIDLATDPWVHYWETLIVKADIQRGCKLAMRAAEDLAREKEADFHDFMDGK